MNYRRELIRYINRYDGSEDMFIKLRDVICEISDKSIDFDDNLMKDLLYIASQKLRTFGYNKLNNFDISGLFEEMDNSFAYQNYAINEYYTSETGILLDKNQKDIINLFQSSEKKRLLVSAPTSFGKTFILREIIFLNRLRYNNILLIFPTISLLNENVQGFIDFTSKMQLDYNIISNTHMEIDTMGRNIFILTPERVLKIINDYPELKLDFFFMDEVYKIDNFFNTASDGENHDEDERDTVFRIVLYTLSNNVKELYIAGPYIDLDNVAEGFRRFIQINSINQFYVRQEPVKKEHIKSWTSQIVVDGEHIRYQSKNKNKISKLKEIISYINKNKLGPTIVYAESKSKATRLARESIGMFDECEKPHIRVIEFIEHLEERYGVKYKGEYTSRFWSLIEMLRSEVGVHHGAFPKYIQNEILDLFNEGYLKIIFTTTSITEGVNTKAKNVIFYGKRKGTKELKVFDIKNISGRAGRYYHYFIGRVFYLESSIYNQIESNSDKLDFVTFSDNDLNYLDLDNVYIGDLTEKNAKIKEERDLLINSYNIEESIFRSNRLIDKMKQIKMIEILKSKKRIELENLVYSCSSIRAFLSNGTIYEILEYFEEIEMISEHEVRRFGKIATDYSKPEGLYLLIKYHLSTLENLSQENVDTTYIKVFSDIRNIIEFKIPKFISIFVNLLKYVCSLPNIQIITENLATDAIIRFFELGVRTQFGSVLAEGGFPIATIKYLENNLGKTMSRDISDIILNFKDYRNGFISVLDKYEYNLIMKQIDIVKRSNIYKLK